jgi:hypothetical protein
MKLLRVNRAAGRIFIHVSLNDGMDLMMLLREYGINAGLIWNPYHDVVVLS